jgi:hypothetical protein
MTRRPEDDDGPDPPRDPLMDVLVAYKGAVRGHGDGGGHPFGARIVTVASKKRPSEEPFPRRPSAMPARSEVERRRRQVPWSYGVGW